MSEEEKPKDWTAVRAGLDQAGEALKEFTPICWGLYESFREQGFTGEEALSLTKAWFVGQTGGKQ